jgi:hypothetical protein
VLILNFDTGKHIYLLKKVCLWSLKLIDKLAGTVIDIVENWGFLPAASAEEKKLSPPVPASARDFLIKIYVI